MVDRLLSERKIPDLREKKLMLDLLSREVYGHLPPLPESMDFEVNHGIVPNFCAGKARLDKITVKLTLHGKDFSFPLYLAMPLSPKKHPLIILINFRDRIPDRYMPTEEIVDNGFAVLSFSYLDVTDDTPDFTNGLAACLFKEGKREADSAGKISLWAWAAHRAMDYAMTLSDKLDITRCAVAGHSRLGKTALWAAATDERFACAFSNNSGSAGAALSRGKSGEQIKDITQTFPYWFAENYKNYAGGEDMMPFDQHFLLASLAPRLIYVASALDDHWADPASEFLSCVAAGKSPVFSSATCDTKAFTHDNRLPVPGDVYHQGKIGYHLRAGAHYLSRQDWQHFMDFLKNKWDNDF